MDLEGGVWSRRSRPSWQQRHFWSGVLSCVRNPPSGRRYRFCHSQNSWTNQGSLLPSLPLVLDWAGATRGLGRSQGSSVYMFLARPLTAFQSCALHLCVCVSWEEGGGRAHCGCSCPELQTKLLKLVATGPNPDTQRQLHINDPCAQNKG